MRTYVSLTLVFFLAAQGFVILSGFIVFAMIGEVNRKLPDERRISYLFGHYSKHAFASIATFTRAACISGSRSR